MLDITVSEQALQVFYEELAEQLDRLETLILGLEKACYPSTVKELFRITHNVKGSSASIGNSEMARLAHGMESVLDAIRGKGLRVSSPLIDLLIRSLDGLRLLKKAMETGQRGETGSPDVNSLVSLLEAFCQDTSPDVTSTFEIRVTIALQCDMPAVRAFQVIQEMKKRGELVHAKPTEKELKEGGAVFSSLVIQLKTADTMESLEKALGHISDISDVSVRALESKLDAIQDQPTKSDLQEIRTIRVNVELFDQLMNLVGELVIGKTRLAQVSAYLKEEDGGPIVEELADSIRQLSKIVSQLQDEVMKARLLPIEVIFGKLPRIVRDLCSTSGKEVDFVMDGEETQLDRTVVEEIGDPILHLLRNAVDHGIETCEDRSRNGKNPKGKIKLKAYHEENHVVIDLEDDGCGIDPDKIRDIALERGLIDREKSKLMTREDFINLIFAPGFSTAANVSEVSGRGVGLDIVKQRIQKIGGKVNVETEVGKGTHFHVRLPFSLAIVQGLPVSISGRTFAVPLSNVVEIVQANKDQLRSIADYEVLSLRGAVVPLIWLGECYQEAFPREREHYNVVIVTIGGKQIGIVVDSYSGKQEFVIKTMGSYIGDLSGISGATVLADGKVGLILDVGTFVQSVKAQRKVIEAGVN